MKELIVSYALDPLLFEKRCRIYQTRRHSGADVANCAHSDRLHDEAVARRRATSRLLMPNAAPQIQRDQNRKRARFLSAGVVKQCPPGFEKR